MDDRKDVDSKFIDDIAPLQTLTKNEKKNKIPTIHSG